MNLWQAGARDNVAGSGVYLLRDAETGQMLKVGSTADFYTRSGAYASLQQWSGNLQMELYPVEGRLASFSAETALRNELRARGEGLFWDASGKRAAAWGFKPGEFYLRGLVEQNPGFGKEGWSLPLTPPQP